MKITVITPTLNNEKTISDCINSFLRQDYQYKEHIVIDGISTDNTLNIIKSLSPNSKIHSANDKSIYDALNKGIKLANSDIIGFLHSDDMFHSEKVLSVIANKFNDDTICAVYGNLIYVSQNDTNRVVRKWVSSEFKIRNIYFGWMPPHPTLYVRKEWYEKIGYFDLSYQISSDYDCILKMFTSKNFNAVYVPLIFIRMRLGGISNKSLLSITKKTFEDLKVFYFFNNSLFLSLFVVICKILRKIPQFLKI